ncbi:MAG: family 10 glycosylhydrolase [Clostridia bacterium]|nr:family 10 glycosylhydrolase [Clostridia bacterium]
MKKIIYIMIFLILVTFCFTFNIWAAAERPKMEAAWMATVFNIDFPSTKNNVAAQKNEYIEKIEGLKSIGINTVIVQVRPKADALYKSDINPWSDVLTGTQGQYPGYDPLAFMIEEAHKRGMALHAWLNPYRVTTSGTDLSKLSPNHPARLHPEWLISCNNALYYNPEIEGVKEHIIASVKEIVENYDVDGIHFDDYFYPSDYPLPPGEKKDGTVANARRQHVNDLVRRVSETIKSTNDKVLFGISPMGIWKNSTSDPTGSSTSGKESYYSVYADTRTWIKEQWIDYVVPQIYWETGNKAADYETLVKWWANEVNGTDVDLYIGHGLYKDVVLKEIDTQLKINRQYPQVKGSFYYGLGNLLANKLGCIEKIVAFNNVTSPGTSFNASKDVFISTKQSPVKKGIVTASVLNVRSQGGLQYAVLTKVPRGTEVTVLNSIPGWHQVQLADGRKGWVSADYIKIID